jgi:hypothetical protein
LARLGRIAAGLGLFAVVGILGCGVAQAKDLFTKSLYNLQLQDPKAKILDDKARRHFVLKEVYDRDCSCFSGLFVNDEKLEMRDDPESPGIVAESGALFLIGEFESRACLYHYFILSFRAPNWPEPARTQPFGDCNAPRSIAFDGKGGMTIRFAQEIVTFRDGKLSRK